MLSLKGYTSSFRPERKGEPESRVIRMRLIYVWIPAFAGMTGFSYSFSAV
jgi:hypothetical protein